MKQKQVVIKRKSHIFSRLEYEEFQLRKQGKKKYYSVWCNRLKPKLLEILNLFKEKKKIIKILK